MDSRRASLLELLAWDERVRFVIPRWQRQYVWGTTGAGDYEVKQLWDDIRTHCLSGGKHFCGVMLLRRIADTEPIGWEIVDGQQRMTTFFLLFIAIRDECKRREIDFSELSHVFTTDKSHECRLILQQGLNNDREVMNALLQDTFAALPQKTKEESRLAKAYQFFVVELVTHVSDQQMLSLVLNILQGIDLLILTVNPDDDTRRIFETLNSRGRRIDPYDLVANLINYIGQEDDEINLRAQQVWYSIQQKFEKDDLEDFLSAFAKRNAQQTARGAILDEIEYEVRVARENKRVLPWLNEFERAAKYYHDIIFPGQDGEPFQAVLDEIRRLRIPKINPFLLALLEAFGDSSVSLPLIMNLRSLMVRILVSNKRPAYKIERFAETACEIFFDLKLGRQEQLNRVSKLIDDSWIPDPIFAKEMAKRDLYAPGAHMIRLRYYLEKLEHKISEEQGQPFESYFGDKTTVEHIMPQTLNETWISSLRTKDHLRLETQHESLVNTLGNLTVLLGCDNSAVKNESFATKKSFYLSPDETLKQMGIRKRKAALGTCALNRYFEQISHWNFQEISRRGQYLASLGLQIWAKIPMNEK
ncbi:MAG: DUF262 domain-containing protein [Candidatus Methylacidiphilales bacterium]